MMVSGIRNEMNEEELSDMLNDLLGDAFSMAEERRSL